MKIKYKAISAVLAVAIFTFSVLLQLAYKADAIALEEPLLYYNDSTWAREDRSPLKYIDDTYYVPLTLFAQLKDIKVRVNNSLNTFVITNGPLYISIDATTNIATDQSENLFILKTYKLDYGERYVPASTVCKYLGLGYDTYTNKSTGETALRINDGSNKLSFKELLEEYNPNLLETVESTPTDVSQETSQSSVSENNPPSSDMLPGRRTIYITFPVGINGNTEDILDTLLKYDFTATFFVDYNDISNYPLVISRILSEGHKLGLMPRDPNIYTNIDSLSSELDRINSLLYRVYKTRSRTVMLDWIYTVNDALTKDIESGKLNDIGYSIWRTSVLRTDGNYQNDVAAYMNIKNIWNNNTVVFDFGSNIFTPYVLDKTLEFINTNRKNCDVRLADSAYNPPF